MSKLSSVKRFMRSRSGRGFFLHLGVCAMLSAAVAYGFHYFSLNWFVEHKSDEKIIALRLVDAFVTNYSAIRSQFGQNAPVPASFRAHAIEAFNKRASDNSDFRLRSVGRPGREIVTPPTDARMAEVIEAFAATSKISSCDCGALGSPGMAYAYVSSVGRGLASGETSEQEERAGRAEHGLIHFLTAAGAEGSPRTTSGRGRAARRRPVGA